MAKMDRMFKQMQELQEKMARLQEELGSREVKHSTGGGMVTATVNGKQELVDLKLDPAAIDPEDPEMLEDMIIAAVNGAMAEASEIAKKEMSNLAGLGNIPGLM